MAAPWWMPAKPLGANGMVVGGLQVRHADHHEQRQRQQLDRHHDVVGGGALARAAQQQPGDQHHDAERRHIDQDGDAEDVRRGLQQPVDRRIGAEQRGAVAGGQPLRKDDAESAQQRVEIIAPGNRHRDVADGVFENQIPADDPRHQFAQRGVGVGVGAARLRESWRPVRRSTARPARRRRPAAGRKRPAPDPRRRGSLRRSDPV